MIERTRQSIGAALLVGALVLGACGDDDATTSSDTTVASETTTTELPDTSGDEPEETSTTTEADSTTTTAPASTTTTTTEVPSADVVTIGALALQPDGLGGVGTFGDDGDAVLLELAAAFNGTAFGGVEGSPDEDSGWAVDTNEVSPCNGQTIRQVRWGDFAVVLADQDTPVFQGWIVRSGGDATGLTTPEGIARGATDAEVRATYGDDAFGDEGVYTQIFVTNNDGPAIRGIMSEEGSGGVVDLLDAGTACVGIAS